MRVCVCVWTEIMFCPQVQAYDGRLLHFKLYKCFPLPFWITLIHVCWKPFGKQNRMRAESECAVMHRGQTEKEGREGPLSQLRWRGGFTAASPWGNMTWGPPASSHRITCDRGGPPPHKSPHLLLFLFLSFITSLMLDMPPNELKINHIFIVCLRRSPLTQIALCLCL